MNNEHKFLAVVATTHRDRHGDRFTKEALEQAVEDFRASDQPLWMNWDHQTTLPPIGITTALKVEPREDGEFQLVAEGEFLDSGHYELLPQSEISGLDIIWAQVAELLNNIELSAEGHIEISYDHINFAPAEVAPVIRSLNELVPTEERHRARKSFVPQPVIWVLVEFAGGIIARFGEVTADKFMKAASAFYKDLSERFAKFLEIKPAERPDVIFSIPIPNSSTTVEGAVEEADKASLEVAWRKLPELYAIASHSIGQNQKDYFLEMKFLFNPSSKNWEINFFTTRKTRKVIQGPRYYDPSHPLRGRYERELERIKGMNSKGTSFSN